MKFIFRPDTEPSIGLGHLMRSLSLAQELRERGHDIIFVAQLNSGAQKLIGELKLNWIELSADSAQQNTEALSHVAHINPDFVVLDHYHVNSEWQKSALQYSKHLMCIDDLINRHFECDFLLNQNAEFNSNPYATLTRKDCRFMFGPKLALLRKEFRTARNVLKPRTGRIEKVLIYFGGGNSNPEVLKVLTAIERYPVKIEFLLLSPQNNGFSSKLPRNVELISPTSSMAALLGSVDLVLGAAGSSVWERSCLGVPSIIVQTADNQRTIVDEASRCGIALSLGGAQNVTSDTWLRVFESKLGDSSFWKTQSERCLATVDGLGVDRVASQLLS